MFPQTMMNWRWGLTLNIYLYEWKNNNKFEEKKPFQVGAKQISKPSFLMFIFVG